MILSDLKKCWTYRRGNKRKKFSNPLAISLLFYKNEDKQLYFSFCTNGEKSRYRGISCKITDY
jgi:hypothetical protein